MASWRRKKKKKKIWNQRWLPEDHHRSIITHVPSLLLDCIVDQLIIQPSKEWDHVLIDRLFIPYDVKAIKCIPLCDQPYVDKLI